MFGYIFGKLLLLLYSFYFIYFSRLWKTLKIRIITTLFIPLCDTCIMRASVYTISIKVKRKIKNMENKYYNIGDTIYRKDGSVVDSASEMANVISEIESDCKHICTSNCRKVGCNCECGEYHINKQKSQN